VIWQPKGLQGIRRTVQFLVLAIMLAIPALSRYTNYLGARELDKNLARWDGTLQGEVLSGFDALLRFLPGGEKERVGRMVRNRGQVLNYAQSLRGGPWSIQVGPISMTDPLAGAESIMASKQFVSVLLISLLIPVIATILLGRIFCSWICPMNLLLEFTDKLRNLLRFLEIRPHNLHFSRWTKYTLLGLGLALSVIMSVPILGYVYPPAIIGREAHDLVFGIFDRVENGHSGFWMGGLTWMSLIVLGIALFEVTISRRWWCRYVCPGGALYSMLGKARLIRVKRVASHCTLCGDCVVVCPMGLVPMQDVMGVECDNCGLCVSSCNDDALGYSISQKDEPIVASFDTNEKGEKNVVQSA
jgi:NapH/MauN family ferredoxin-type protein